MQKDKLYLDTTYPWIRAGKSFFGWLWDFRPICFCNHEKILQNSNKEFLKQYESRLKIWQSDHEWAMNKLRNECQEKIDKVVGPIVDRATRISFFADNSYREEYAVQIRFSPQYFGMGFWSREQASLLAQYVGRKVEAEIASLRFIQSAKVEEYNYYVPEIPKMVFNPNEPINKTFDPTIKPTKKPKKKK